MTPSEIMALAIGCLMAGGIGGWLWSLRHPVPALSVATPEDLARARLMLESLDELSRLFIEHDGTRAEVRRHGERLDDHEVEIRILRGLPPRVDRGERTDPHTKVPR